MIETLLFYAFSTVLLLSAFMVVAGPNPVHSVLFLIVCFFNVAALFLMLGAEFLSMLLVIVYVGAVAVLFLFVVMMLDVKLDNIRTHFKGYATFGSLIALLLISEFILVILGTSSPSGMIVPHPMPTEVTNTHALGDILYTYYDYVLQIAGLILLVAMIGAIALTLRHRDDVRRQHIGTQNARTPSQTLEVRQVPFNEGVDVP